mgnify:CR=1 FL=1
MRVVPDTGKNIDCQFRFLGELNAHLFLYVKVLLAPDDFNGRLEFLQIGFEQILVSGEV